MNARIFAAVSAVALLAVTDSVAIANAYALYQFQSPGGNISCVMAALAGSSPEVSCEAVDHTWVIPPRPQSCLGAWGDRVNLVQGSWPAMACHSDTTRGSGLPTLQYGETHTVASLTCESKPAGITCTDASTGHYFRMSRDSFDLK